MTRAGRLPSAALSAAWIFILGLILSVADPSFAGAATPKTLEIYFIDVEGGQSTLVVTPDKHALLIDAGWAADGSNSRPGDPRLARDANRIVAAARDAGIKQIDFLLATHFHPDHIGGVPELSQLMPIREFIDHGVGSEGMLSQSAENRAAFDDYMVIRNKGKHLEPQLGDRLPLHDIEAIVVSSAGATISAPLPHAGATNTLCPDHATPSRDPYENPRSTGIVLRYGKFRFLDIGDLSGEPLFNLVCPKDLMGPVDVYLVAHHGGPDVADPAIFSAFKPRVAVMNNGLTKGGARVTYQALHHVAGLEDVWQLHISTDAGDSNFPAPFAANLDEGTAYWIKVVAQEDGSFRVFNPRTREWKRYAPRSR